MYVYIMGLNGINVDVTVSYLFRNGRIVYLINEKYFPFVSNNKEGLSFNNLFNSSCSLVNRLLISIASWTASSRLCLEI